MSADKTVTAVFEPIKLTVSMDPAGAGSVNVTPPNQTDDEPFTVTFAGAINSQQVSATAYPNVGWAFKEWTGDHTDTENPATIDVNGEEEVTAVFEEVELTVDTEGKGVVHIDPPDITPEEEEYPHTEKYASADPQDPPKVDLVASPTDANWGFKEWTGDVEPPADAAAIAVVMDAAKSVTAVFAQVEVTINVEGSGSVSTDPAGEVLSETRKGFAYGAAVAFTATADPGWAFKEWSGAVTGTEPTASPEEPLTSNITVTALFEQIKLTVDTQGTGKVTISPPVVTPEVEAYPHTEVYPLSTQENPQSVTLTAVDVANWGFKEWTGDVEGPANLATTQVEMDAPKTVTAVFEQAVLTMNVAGEGTIGTTPVGEVLSATTKGFRPGDPNVEDPITIEAFPGAEWGFEKWTGAIYTTDNPAPIEMDSDQSVTAVFYQNTLTVTGSGQGQVSTGGEPRTPTFTEDFKPGKQVNLEAHPEDGWFFAGWSGAVTSASSTAQVTMTEDKTVHALFERIELTVEKQGEGTVTATPPGGQPSVPFTQAYSAGQGVTLSATAAPGWGFKQWIGEVTPSGATATVTMNRAKTVTAVFAQATLSVDKDGEGTVSVYPPGGAQELPFSETHAYNATVSLVPFPDGCWYFSHWEGDVAQEDIEDNPLGVRLLTSKSITAVFEYGPLEFLEPNGDPVTDNHYVFQSGVCTVNPQASNTGSGVGCEYDWELEGIAGSTLAVAPDPPNTLTPVFTYTGLPTSNSEFGDKELKVSDPGGESSEDTTVQIFFSLHGTDHPVVTNLSEWLYTPANGSASIPNWYYYWKQTSANYGTHVLGESSKTVPPWEPPPHLVIVGADAGYIPRGTWYVKNHTRENKTPVGPPNNPAEQLTPYEWESEGIDTFAWVCRHEATHKAVFIEHWPAPGPPPGNPGYWTRNGAILDEQGNIIGDSDGDGITDHIKDADEDGIPDIIEPSLGYDPDMTSTNGTWEDGEDYVMWRQAKVKSWTPGTAQSPSAAKSEDWSSPGQQSNE